MATIEELRPMIGAGRAAKLILEADDPENPEKKNLTIFISQDPAGPYKWRKFYHDHRSPAVSDAEHKTLYQAWNHMIEAIGGIQTCSDQWVLEP